MDVIDAVSAIEETHNLDGRRNKKQFPDKFFANEESAEGKMLGLLSPNTVGFCFFNKQSGRLRLLVSDAMALVACGRVLAAILLKQTTSSKQPPNPKSRLKFRQKAKTASWLSPQLTANFTPTLHRKAIHSNELKEPHNACLF